MDLRALRKTASLLEHAKKPTFAVLNDASPHTAIADEAAMAITEQFKMTVSPLRASARHGGMGYSAVHGELCISDFGTTTASIPPLVGQSLYDSGGNDSFFAYVNTIPTLYPGL
jgi:hypothetical protein